MPSEKAPVFECQQCGECCNGYGGTYVSNDNIEAIAEFVGLPVAQFKTRYCSRSGSRYVLSQNSEGVCAFVKNRICSIHPVKPRMCRAWPYIPAILTDVANWHKMATCCPGMRTDMSDEEILETVQRKLKKVSD